MELVDRFRYIMKLNQLSASAFADEIGVQRSSVSHVLSGRNKPSLEFIQKILKTYPKVDANWLINGTTKVEQSHTTGEIDFGEQKQETEQTTTLMDRKEAAADHKEDSTVDKPTGRRVERIVIFYSDQTFETFQK